MINSILNHIKQHHLKKISIRLLLIVTAHISFLQAYAVNINHLDMKEKQVLEDTSADTSDNTEDPLEGFNRLMFGLHEIIDGMFLQPAAEIYGTVTHTYIQERVHNVLQNLSTPSTFINDCLQGEGERAAQSLARFMFNSSLGIGGLYDFSQHALDIPSHQEDLGQTFATHGIDAGPYLFIPVLGPSTVRDFVGTVLDFIIDPINYGLRHFTKRQLVYARTFADGLDQRTKLLPVTDRLAKRHDPYVSYRVLYMQNREFNIKNGNELERETPIPDEE